MSRVRFPWPLAIFPGIEVGLFAAACMTISTSPLLGAGLLALAGVALSFAIHIFFHECLHYSDRYPLGRWFTWPASTLIGLPFDGYRVHHRNHHRHGNADGDFSSTWRHTAIGRTPCPVLPYVLGWPRQNLAASRAIRSGEHMDQAVIHRIPAQRRILLLCFAVLTLISFTCGVMYLVLIYLGWAGAALHNYGQHPPVADGDTTTCARPLYNRLLFNNGLHWEHHAHPGRPWHALQVDARSPRIALPHPLHPLAAFSRSARKRREGHSHEAST